MLAGAAGASIASIPGEEANERSSQGVHAATTYGGEYTYYAGGGRVGGAILAYDAVPRIGEGPI